jgi:hypothetical protein
VPCRDARQRQAGSAAIPATLRGYRAGKGVAIAGQHEGERVRSGCGPARPGQHAGFLAGQLGQGRQQGGAAGRLVGLRAPGQDHLGQVRRGLADQLVQPRDAEWRTEQVARDGRAGRLTGTPGAASTASRRPGRPRGRRRVGRSVLLWCDIGC